MNPYFTLALLIYIAVLLVAVAQKLRISYPIALVIGGSVLGFVPGLTLLEFDPSILLVIVLPPILFYASLGLSFKEFIKYFSDIFALAIILVIVTTVVVACVFKWLFPELSWPIAIAFGAIISPPDAVTTTAILKLSPVSSRLRTILEGESLLNDATALVIYRFAVLAMVTGEFHLKAVVPEAFYVVIGGIFVGLFSGFVFTRISALLSSPLAVVHSLFIPYGTYVFADFLNVSGVLAVVSCGLLISRILITKRPPLTRVLGWISWDLFIILLNCFVFILIGLEFRQILEKMSLSLFWLYSGYGVLITFTMIVVRFTLIYVKRILSYFFGRKDGDIVRQNKIYFVQDVISSWSGMRGIVSLTAALALPLSLKNGQSLEGRDIVIFLTFEVIFLTLVIPGLTLPILIKWLKIPPSLSHDEMLEARKNLSDIAKNEIDKLHSSKYLDDEDSKLLAAYFCSHHKVRELSSVSEENKIEKARHRIIQKQRQHLMKMWKNNEVNDSLLNDLERELDIEESHLARGEI